MLRGTGIKLEVQHPIPPPILQLFMPTVSSLKTKCTAHITQCRYNDKFIQIKTEATWTWQSFVTQIFECRSVLYICSDGKCIVFHSCISTRLFHGTYNTFILQSKQVSLFCMRKIPDEWYQINKNKLEKSTYNKYKSVWPR